jgi:hypothetical protein
VERSRQVLERMLQAQAGKAFSLFAAATGRQKMVRETLRGVSLRVMRRCIGRAHATWRNNAADLQRQKTLCSRAVKRMMMGLLAVAFESWRGNSMECRRLKSVCSRAVKRMMMRGLATAFEGWQHNAAKIKIERGICSRAVKRMMMLDLAVSFETWKHNAAEYSEQNYQCSRIEKRMMMRSLGFAFETWWDSATDLKGRREVFSRVIGRCLRSCLSHAFDSWCAAVLEAVHEREEAEAKQVHDKEVARLEMEMGDLDDRLAESRNEVERLEREKSEHITRLKKDKDEEVMRLEREKEEEIMRLKKEKEEEVIALLDSVSLLQFERESLKSENKLLCGETVAAGGALEAAKGEHTASVQLRNALEAELEQARLGLRASQRDFEEVSDARRVAEEEGERMRERVVTLEGLLKRSRRLRLMACEAMAEQLLIKVLRETGSASIIAWRSITVTSRRYASALVRRSMQAWFGYAKARIGRAASERQVASQVERRVALSKLMIWRRMLNGVVELRSRGEAVENVVQKGSKARIVSAWRRHAWCRAVSAGYADEKRRLLRRWIVTAAICAWKGVARRSAYFIRVIAKRLRTVSLSYFGQWHFWSKGQIWRRRAVTSARKRLARGRITSCFGLWALRLAPPSCNLRLVAELGGGRRNALSARDVVREWRRICRGSRIAKVRMLAIKIQLCQRALRGWRLICAHTARANRSASFSQAGMLAAAFGALWCGAVDARTRRRAVCRGERRWKLAAISAWVHSSLLGRKHAHATRMGIDALRSQGLRAWHTAASHSARARAIAARIRERQKVVCMIEGWRAIVSAASKTLGPRKLLSIALGESC